MEKKKLLKQKTRTSFDFVNLPGEKLTYAPQINEAVEFDQPNIIENQENKDKTIYYPSLSSVIALNGVQVRQYIKISDLLRGTSFNYIIHIFTEYMC